MPPLAANEFFYFSYRPIALLAKSAFIMLPGRENSAKLGARVKCGDPRHDGAGGHKLAMNTDSSELFYDEVESAISAASVPSTAPPALAATEARLCRLEDRFTALQASSGHIIWVADAEGSVAEDLPSWRLFTGQSEQEVLGSGWADAVHPDDRERTVAHWRQCATERRLFEITYRLRRHDGVWRTVFARGGPVFETDGSVREWIGYCADITERRELEQRTSTALEALLAMARALVDLPDSADPAAIAAVSQRLVDLGRSVLGCQRVVAISYAPATDSVALVASIGMTPKEEAWFRDFITSRTAREQLAPEYLAQLERGAPCVLAFPTAKGKKRHPFAQALIAPLRIGDRLIGAYFFDYGDTAHVSTLDELDLASATAQLAALVLDRAQMLRDTVDARRHALAMEDANRRMDEFLGVASHELRTPLTSMKANVQLARRWVAALPLIPDGTPHTLRRLKAIPDLMTRIDRQINRFDRLINDLLDMSRIQAGKLELRPEPCDLGEIALSVVGEHRLTSPDRVIVCHTPEHKALPLLADPDRIEQVITNFLTNALKFSPDHKLVTVTVERVGRMGRVAVRDEGPGLPREERARIWERFHQATGIEHQNGSGVGLGLGLYICKSIVKRHHGRVGVTSAPGAGATFWFTVPLAENSADQQPAR